MPKDRGELPLLIGRIGDLARFELKSNRPLDWIKVFS